MDAKNTETYRERVREIRKTVTESINGKLKDLDNVRETLYLVSEALESEEAKASMTKAMEVLLYYKAGVVDTLKLIDYDLKIEEEF